MLQNFKTYFLKTFSSLQIKNYRLYFTGQAISQIGTWMQTIGQAWLVLQLSHSGTQLGLVSATQFLPVLLFGPYAGVIIDKTEKRKIVFITQILFALEALLLGMVLSLGILKLWMIYIFAIILGLLTAIDTPARQTFVHEMVGRDNLQNAVSLNAALFNLTRVLGPAIAGILIAVVKNYSYCFFINAFSYLAVIIALYFIDATKLHKKPLLEQTSASITEGLKYLKSNPIILDLIFTMLLIGTFVYEFQVSIPLLAQKTFLGDARVYAALTSAMGIGSCLGGLWAATKKNSNFDKVVKSIWLLSFSLFLVSILKNFYLALLALAFVGFAATSYSSRGNVTLQLNSDRKMRGRMMALWNTAFTGTTPIGGPILGFLGQQFNPQLSLIVGAIAAFFAGIYGYLRQKSRERFNI